MSISNNLGKAMLNERRSFPRYVIEFPVFVSVEEANKSDIFSTVSVNVSQSGIELACDAELVDALQSMEEFPASCTLEFQLPDTEQTLNIDCQVKSQRRLSQHKFYLVVLFIDFNEGSEELLAKYVDELPSL